MTEQKLNEIISLQDEIGKKKRFIRNIDLIISSGVVGGKIVGAPSQKLRVEPEYYSSNKKEIIRLLEIDKEQLLVELSELQKKFSEA